MPTIWNRSDYDFVEKDTHMLAVIGNVIAGLLGVGLFTATVRLSK
jgi:hypothetical protein